MLCGQIALINKLLLQHKCFSISDSDVRRWHKTCTDCYRMSHELSELGHSSSKRPSEPQGGNDSFCVGACRVGLEQNAACVVYDARQSAFQHWAQRIRRLGNAMHTARDTTVNNLVNRCQTAQRVVKDYRVMHTINKLRDLPFSVVATSGALMSAIERKVIEFAKPPELPDVNKVDRDLVQRVCLTMLSVHGEDEFVADQESGWRVNDIGDGYTVVVMLNPGIRIDYFDMNAVLNVDLSRVRNVWVENVEEQGKEESMKVFVAEISKVEEHKSVTHVTIVERVKKKRKQ